MNDDTYAAEFVAGFLVGALVGAAVALLFAPQRGEETRTLIRERGIELGQKAEELQSQAKDRANALQSKVKEAVEEGKAAAADKRQQLLSQLDQEQADLEIG